MKAKAKCRNCDELINIEVGKEIDGYREVQCHECGYQQLVYIEMRPIVVPVAIGYARRW